MTRKDLMALALAGATVRLKEMADEVAALRRAFPALRGTVEPHKAHKHKAARPAPKVKKRKKLSKAARRAVSVRMKKMWADKRKAAD